MYPATPRRTFSLASTRLSTSPVSESVHQGSWRFRRISADCSFRLPSNSSWYHGPLWDNPENNSNFVNYNNIQGHFMMKRSASFSTRDWRGKEGRGSIPSASLGMRAVQICKQKLRTSGAGILKPACTRSMTCIGLRGWFRINRQMWYNGHKALISVVIIAHHHRNAHKARFSCTATTYKVRRICTLLHGRFLDKLFVKHTVTNARIAWGSFPIRSKHDVRSKGVHDEFDVL